MCVCLQTHVFLGARGEESSISHYPIFYSYFVCRHTYVHMNTCMTANVYHTRGDLRTTCRNQFTPSTM